MNWGLLFLALLALGLAALWLARRQHAATGLPPGQVIYTDTTRWRPTERPLFSRTHRLTGRPDYLVQRDGDTIPVEVKSGSAPPHGPYDSHILQLAVYCLLVEEAFDRRPPHGLIVYTTDKGQAHQIDYTPALEARLLETLDEMRQALVEGDAPRNHAQAVRCQACGYRYACDQAVD